MDTTEPERMSTADWLFMQIVLWIVGTGAVCGLAIWLVFRLFGG